MSNGLKETLAADIYVEFTDPRAEYGTDEIAEFAAQSLKRGDLTSEEIAEALCLGILSAGRVKRVDDGNNNKPK